MPFILDLRPFHGVPPRSIGGKAGGLLHLERAGLSVPPWRVIPADQALSRPWEHNSNAARALTDLFRVLSQPPFGGVAVRSSAELEDGAHSSQAGRFATVFADRNEELPGALRAVLDSGPAMAVVLQARVQARISGVLFSAHPAQARPGEAYVEAVHGPGQGLVDGSRAPSRFWLDLASCELLRSEPGTDGPSGLAPSLVRSLLEPLFRLEEALEAPVDVEWAADDTGLWFLQARPITAVEADASLRLPECSTSWFFDQRFFEPIRPLTRTTLLPLIVRSAIAEALAMRGRTAPEPLFRIFAGQAYVPHAVYRTMLAGAPGWWLSQDLRQLFPRTCGCRNENAAWGALWHYVWSALRSVASQRGDVFFNLRAWEQYCSELREALSRLPEAAPDSEREWLEQWRTLDRLNERFLQIHRWSYLWANYVYRLVRGLARAFPRAMRAVEHRAGRVTREANAALAQALRGEDVPGFLDRYGHRAESLDYAAPTWAELFAAGQLAERYSAAPSPPAPDDELSGRQWGLFGRIGRMLELREEQRFEWERVLARQRQMLLASGRSLHERGILAEVDDVFFLEWEELLGTLFHGRVAPNLALRKHAWRLDARIAKPLFAGPQPPGETPQGRVLTGIGASPGVIRGRVVVLRHPGELAGMNEAEAVAVLTTLDPAWTLFLPRVRALVVERGGVLSHAAILAREYGVPMVIGVEDATRRLRTGMDVSVDAHRGVIAVHPGPAPQ